MKKTFWNVGWSLFLVWMVQSGCGEATEAKEVEGWCSESSQGALRENRHSTVVSWTEAYTQSTGSEAEWV